jgi:hypothetical protein
VIVHGVLLPDGAERQDLRANYAPPIVLRQAGGHWYETWLMIRDSLSYWPWYNRTHAGQRQVVEDFSAERMHDWNFEVMKQFESYHHLINAALDADAAQALAQIKKPVLVIDDADHRFSVYAAKLAGVAPRADRVAVKKNVAALAAAIERFVGAS